MCRTAVRIMSTSYRVLFEQVLGASCENFTLIVVDAIAQRQGEKVALRVRTFPQESLAEGEYVPAATIESHGPSQGSRVARRASASLGVRRDALLRQLRADPIHER
jgi:hypothetical protein